MCFWKSPEVICPSKLTIDMTSLCHSSYELLLLQTANDGMFTREKYSKDIEICCQRTYFSSLHMILLFYGYAISPEVGKHFSCWSYLSSMCVFFIEAVVTVNIYVFTLVFHLKIFIRGNYRCYKISVILQ